MMSIDLHTTPCTYFHRVSNSGNNAFVSLNRQTNVYEGFFALSNEAKKSIIELREGLSNGKIIVNGTSYTDRPMVKRWRSYREEAIAKNNPTICLPNTSVQGFPSGLRPQVNPCTE